MIINLKVPRFKKRIKSHEKAALLLRELVSIVTTDFVHDYPFLSHEMLCATEKATNSLDEMTLLLQEEIKNDLS